MSNAASNFLENKILDHVLRYGTAPYTAPSTVYLALFTGTAETVLAQLEAGTLTSEVSTSGTAYARKAIAFDAAADGSIDNASPGVTFDPATDAWGTVTCVALMDSGTAGAGNVLFYGQVTTAKQIDENDTFAVSAGALTVSLA
jgi:hypothetical protein